MANMIYLWCKDCEAVREVSPEPACVHFGRVPKRRNAESVTVVFRSPDGKVSIPWEPNAPCPKGYVREEVRGARAVRRLEKELDAKDMKRYQRFQENRQRLFRHDKRREDLKQIVSQGVTTKIDHDGSRRTIQVSQFGRDLAREALRKMDNAPSERYEPGNYRRE